MLLSLRRSNKTLVKDSSNIFKYPCLSVNDDGDDNDDNDDDNDGGGGGGVVDKIVF